MSKDEKKDKLIIPIDITDWRDETYRAEEPITSEEDIYNALANGKSTGEVAKATVVSRALQIAPDDILRPDKLLYYTGAVADVSAIAKRKRHEISVESGKTYEVSELVGYPGRKHDLEEGEIPNDEHISYVTMEDPQAVEYTMRYLLNVIPGHVWNRLLVLHAWGEDVEEAADELIVKIEEMVKRIIRCLHVVRMRSGLET